MNNNYKLEKEYKIPFETFRKAYYAFQKKNVLPKSYLFMGLFLVIAVIYIIAAVKDPSNTLAYVLICVCIALAAREWYNPRKIRRNILDAVREENLEDETYKIIVAEEFVEISTLPGEELPESEPEESGEAEESEEYHEEELPEASRLAINDDLSVFEYDDFFLLHVKKQMFYVVPKQDFTDSEIEIIRNIKP